MNLIPSGARMWVIFYSQTSNNDLLFFCELAAAAGYSRFPAGLPPECGEWSLLEEHDSPSYKLQLEV